MKNLSLILLATFFSISVASQESKKTLNYNESNQDSLILTNCDGTPEYRNSVEQSYRMLQYKTSIFGNVPEFGSGIRLGIYQVQAYSGQGATQKNMQVLEEAVKQAKKFDVQLLSFPELFVPGYTLSPEEAKKVSEFKDGPSISKACKLAKEYNMALIVPYAEKLVDNGVMKYYDAIAVINEKGELLNSYRKTHLYGQQERDNWCFGHSEYPVYELFGFPVGVLNCYECEFPELQRILALNGAKLIVGPTAADNYYRLPNGERSSVPYPDISTLLIPANAYANDIFFAYANRCGYEVRGKDAWHYRGNSIICGPHGDIIVAANHEQNTMLIADCIPANYGMTHPAPDYYYLRDRRPGMYKQLTAPKANFKNIKETDVNTNTNFNDGGFTYPDYSGCKEVPAKKK